MHMQRDANTSYLYFWIFLFTIFILNFDDQRKYCTCKLEISNCVRLDITNTRNIWPIFLKNLFHRINLQWPVSSNFVTSRQMQSWSIKSNRCDIYIREMFHRSRKIKSTHIGWNTSKCYSTFDKIGCKRREIQFI